MAYSKPVIAPPWGGWKDDLPANVAQMNSFRQITNWLINKNRLMPFPNTTAFPSFTEVDTNGVPFPFLGLRTFQDGLGNYHTLGLSTIKPHYYDGAVWQGLSNGFGGPLNFVPASGQPFSVEVVLNKAFFANGGEALDYVDGDQFWYKAGDAPGTCYYLGKLGAHLMMVNTIEPAVGVAGSMRFVSRVRWSMSGNPFVWITNPATGLSEPTAGFEDIVDVEDQLTGWATIGVTGFVFRNNGITAVSTTGALPPFRFENFSIGPKGIGCAVPYTLATYGPFCCFVSIDDVYYFDGGIPQRIGGNAKRSLFNDVYNASSQCTAYIIGRLWQGVDYLAYWLACPQSNNTFTSMWIYHFDDQTWVNAQLPNKGLVTLGEIVIS